MEIEVDYEKLKRTPLGDHEISSYLNGRTQVIKYNEIPKYKNIEEFLGPYGNAVILLETKRDFGHWICLKITGNVISFFDSYGDFPDQQKNFVNAKFLKDSGQKFNIICKMLDDASYKYTIEFSDRRLQNMDDLSIATCGHWCSVFIKSGMLVDEFYDFIDEFGEPDLDKLIVELYYNQPQNKKMKYN